MASFDFDAPRLFVDAPLMAGARIGIKDDRANYLLNVLRLRDGDHVLIFNGRDGEWRAALTGTTRKATTLECAENTRAQSSGPDLDWCFAPLKHARLDYMVQKAVEMGASRLCPVMTRRTQASRINAERMRANAIEAAEQCGILSIPEIAPSVSFDQLMATWDDSRLLVFCDEDAPVASPAAALSGIGETMRARGHSKVGLLIGPEGGFDESERAALLSRPFVLRLSLGPRVLRADTAAVAALALVQTFLGDWR